jgi:hypothetical protein
VAAQVADMAGRDHLEGERKNAAFDVHAMTALIYGGKVRIRACLVGALCNKDRIMCKRALFSIWVTCSHPITRLDPPRIVHS